MVPVLDPPSRLRENLLPSQVKSRAQVQSEPRVQVEDPQIKLRLEDSLQYRSPQTGRPSRERQLVQAPQDERLRQHRAPMQHQRTPRPSQGDHQWHSREQEHNENRLLWDRTQDVRLPCELQLYQQERQQLPQSRGYSAEEQQWHQTRSFRERPPQEQDWEREADLQHGNRVRTHSQQRSSDLDSNRQRMRRQHPSNQSSLTKGFHVSRVAAPQYTTRAPATQMRYLDAPHKQSQYRAERTHFSTRDHLQRQLRASSDGERTQSQRQASRDPEIRSDQAELDRVQESSQRDSNRQARSGRRLSRAARD